MAEEIQAIPTTGSPSARLATGLARNTVFNFLGWVWPIGLALFSIPYIVKSLGNDAFGVFSVVSIVAGYLSLFYLPLSMGSIRYIAGSYARQDWPELRKMALAGIVINGAFSFLGALLLFALSGVLARVVFRVPVPLIKTSIVSFRLSAVSYFLNGIVGALQSVPSAMRRFDVRNIIGIIVGTLNTFAIVVTLWMGWGLLGAVSAQIFSSVLALAIFGGAVWSLLRKLPDSGQKTRIGTAYLKRLGSFSSLLFAGQLSSQIGLQIDRTLVGILLGTSAVTYYTIPTRITDRIPGMMSVFSGTLYPLSAEAAASGKLDELRHLYHEMIRLLLWLSACIATVLIVVSKDFLRLWVGREFVEHSWLVLALLAAGVVWRSSGTVAYQVCNGLGRADINLIASIGTAIFLAIPVLILAPRRGTSGVAFGVFIGLLFSNLAYDLFTQRKLIGSKSWLKGLAPYGRIVFAVSATVASSRVLSGRVAGWFELCAKASLVTSMYIFFSLLVGALRVRDFKYVAQRLNSFYRRMRSRKRSVFRKAWL